MIVSVIWWKRVEGTLKAVILTPLLLLGGCGVEQVLFGRPPAEAPPAPLPPARSDASQGDVSTGLAPLPTPQQVLTAVPFGRPDPFAPLQAPAAAATAAATGSSPASGRSGTAAAAPSPTPGAPPPPGDSGSAATRPPARLAQPQDFQLSGVIRSGGRAEALVSYRGLSGSIKAGDRGGSTTMLLPPGWALASIQFGGRSPQDPPSVILQRGPQTVQVKLH